MRHCPIFLLAAVLAAGAWMQPAAAQDATCERLRADIEARIRANGVGDGVVEVADAAASAPGRQVGNCDRGARKLMYRRVPGAAASAPRAPAVITECADGRVLTSGNCRSR